MNKTTKFLNKLINDTKSGIVQWVDIENNYQAIVNDETIVLKYTHNAFDGVNVDMYIIDRYTLYPKWIQIVLLTRVIKEQVKNKKTRMPDYVKVWIDNILK